MWTILSEVADWAAYKLTLDAKKGAADHSIIFQNAIPEMLGRLLSLLTNSQELGLFTESNLLSLRVPIMSMFDSYRTVAYTDSYYDLLELYLASLLATIARNFSQVCWLRLKLMYIALPSSSLSTPSFFLSPDQDHWGFYSGTFSCYRIPIKNSVAKGIFGKWIAWRSARYLGREERNV